MLPTVRQIPHIVNVVVFALLLTYRYGCNSTRVRTLRVFTFESAYVLSAKRLINGINARRYPICYVCSRNVTTITKFPSTPLSALSLSYE